MNYVGLEAAGQTINRTEVVDGKLHCFHDDQLLQIVDQPDDSESSVDRRETMRP